MIVTLTTDFGTADYFVGAMKGAILAVNPQACVIDITHEIPTHDIQAGAFTLLAAYDTFPPATVHVAVVDPGVGSSRRGIVATGSGYTFVAPDNGILGYVYDRVEDLRVFELTKPEFFREPVSSSFHGRDVFAPVAGVISRGIRPDELGTACSDFHRLPLPKPQSNQDGSIIGAILHVDRFGNCITNITRHDLRVEADKGSFRLLAGNREIRTFRQFFSEKEKTSEPFAIWGSAGFLEVSIYLDSAATSLGIRRGDVILLELK